MVEEIAVARLLSGQKPALFLLHPIGLDRSFWQPVEEALATAGIQAVALDLPGHGAEPAGGEISLDAAASYVLDKISRHTSGPAIIAGCSLGGMVAQLAALKAPAAVSGLILANTGCEITEAGSNALRALASVTAEDPGGIVERALARWFDADFRAAHPDKVEAIATILRRAAPATHAAYWRAIAEGLHFRDRIAGIHCPVLLFFGSRDKSTPVSVARDMLGLLRDARLIEVDAEHLAPFEQPEAFARGILSLVNRPAAAAELVSNTGSSS